MWHCLPAGITSRDRMHQLYEKKCYCSYICMISFFFNIYIYTIVLVRMRVALHRLSKTAWHCPMQTDWHSVTADGASGPSCATAPPTAGVFDLWIPREDDSVSLPSEPVLLSQAGCLMVPSAVLRAKCRCRLCTHEETPLPLMRTTFPANGLSANKQNKPN